MKSVSFVPQLFQEVVLPGTPRSPFRSDAFSFWVLYIKSATYWCIKCSHVSIHHTNTKIPYKTVWQSSNHHIQKFAKNSKTFTKISNRQKILLGKSRMNFAASFSKANTGFPVITGTLQATDKHNRGFSYSVFRLISLIVSCSK